MARKIVAVKAVLFALLSLAAAPSLAANGPGSLCNTPGATGCAGATSLPVFNPTHYALVPGVTITSKIIGATDLLGTETCSSGPAGVDVIIKSSQFGNETVCGSLSSCPGAGCTITFTYTAPNGPVGVRLPDGHRRLRLEREQLGQRHHRQRRQGRTRRAAPRGSRTPTAKER